MDGHVGAPSAVLDASRPYKTEKRRIVEAFERQYLTRLMMEHGGNVHPCRACGEEGAPRLGQASEAVRCATVRGVAATHARSVLSKVSVTPRW